MILLFFRLFFLLLFGYRVYRDYSLPDIAAPMYHRTVAVNHHQGTERMIRLKLVSQAACNSDV